MVSRDFQIYRYLVGFFHMIMNFISFVCVFFWETITVQSCGCFWLLGYWDFPVEFSAKPKCGSIHASNFF